MNRKTVLILTTLFILSLVGISFFGGPVSYIFFYLVLIIPAVCALYIFFVIASLKIYQKTDGRMMVCNRASDFYITLNNESFFSFTSIRMIFYSSFSSVTGLDDETVYELPPHTSITRTTKLTCRYRGEYLVGIKEIEVHDFLGLFTYRYRIKEPLCVVVSPAIVMLSELNSIADLPDAKRDSPYRTSEVDIPVREYVPGDDIRLLHQNASAALCKPMIRTLTGAEKTGIGIVMEPSRYSADPAVYLPAENRIIESVLALSLYFVSRNTPVDVIYRTAGIKCDAISSHPDFEKLYEVMRTYSFGEPGLSPVMFEEIGALVDTNGYELLICVLYKLDADSAGLIERLGASSVPVRIYVVEREGLPDTAVQLSHNSEVMVIGTKKATEDIL